jgi:hypothetical protein
VGQEGGTDDESLATQSAGSFILIVRLKKDSYMPKHQIVSREFDLPGSDSRQLPLAAVKTRIGFHVVGFDCRISQLPDAGGPGVDDRKETAEKKA